MSQCQAPFTEPEEYFTNNGSGYKRPYTIFLKKYNIKIKCYFNTLNQKQIKEMTKSISEIFKSFFEAFPDSKHASENLEIFKIYIFNDKKDYQRLGNKVFNFGLGAEGGLYHYLGTKKVHSHLYLYQREGLPALKHELTHALTYYATKGNCSRSPKFIMEGIADYFGEPSSVLNLTCEECTGLTYQILKKLDYSEDRKKNNLLYDTGNAIIHYLQSAHPWLINQYFTELRKGEFLQAKKLLQFALDYPEKTKNWLYQFFTRTELNTNKLIENMSQRYNISANVKNTEKKYENYPLLQDLFPLPGIKTTIKEAYFIKQRGRG